MTTKQDIINAQRPAYLKGNKQEKGRILDSIALTTGLQRKAIIQRFRRLPRRSPGSGKRRGRKRRYGSDVTPSLAGSLAGRERDLWRKTPPPDS